MSRGVGEFLVETANKRGMVVFVDTDNIVKLYPKRLLTQEFLRVANRYYYHVKHFLISDAVST